MVATPIGNLQDISPRAIATLKEADFILCEDTRVTIKLLRAYHITTPFLSYHQHSGPRTRERIIQLLREGKNIALVSDAGTPGIRDPGGELVDQALRSLGDYLKIIPVPGPSALLAAASVSGFPMDKFLFLGFPPHTKKRKKFFTEMIQSKYPVIFYESPYRILKTLSELKAMRPDIKIVLCREMTKKFESSYRGLLADVIEMVKKDPQKGEYTAVIFPQRF